MAHHDDRLDELEAELRRAAPDLFRDLEADARAQGRIPEQDVGDDREVAGVEGPPATPVPSSPRPRRPAAPGPAPVAWYERRVAWVLLVLALLGLGFGIALGQGLVIAVGLVLAGLAGHLFDRCHAGVHSEPPNH
ncbi:hypothetical protein [Streptomyces oceani]|uniref:DUF3040 domain-containing protein n=1 Tax=Streptomyces oceani TaxID=1075402 RepID=A0A1E7JWK4_9ACTN|nr:hypothetical protein [Streptomyces oceani]OEU95979.1 hypothetical protein AN216_22905 [Streptomyces oceani]